MAKGLWQSMYVCIPQDIGFFFFFFFAVLWFLTGYPSPLALTTNQPVSHVFKEKKKYKKKSEQRADTGYLIDWLEET